MNIKQRIYVLIIFGLPLSCVNNGRHYRESAVSIEKGQKDHPFVKYNDMACECNGRIIMGMWLGSNKDTLVSISFDVDSLKQKKTLLLGKSGNQSDLTVLAVPGFYNPLCSDVFFTNVDTLLYLEITEGSLVIQSVVSSDSAVHMTGLLNGTYRSRNLDEIRLKDVLIKAAIGSCGF